MFALIGDDACSPPFNDRRAVTLPPAVIPLVGILRQTAALIALLTDEQYARKPVGVVPSSIGGHVRHSLDHIDALLRAAVEGVLDHDRRARDTEVERCRCTALETIRRQEQQFLELPWPPGSQSLRLSVLLTPDTAPVEVLTSLDRELAFVLSHTIHHNALVAVMAKLLGIAVPQDFGYAPSTLAHERSATCVR